MSRRGMNHHCAGVKDPWTQHIHTIPCHHRAWNVDRDMKTDGSSLCEGGKMKKLLWIIGAVTLLGAILFFGYTTIYGIGEVPLRAVEGGVLQSYEWWYACPKNPEECTEPPTPTVMPTPTCILTVPCPTVTYPLPTSYPTQPPLKTPGAP